MGTGTLFLMALLVSIDSFYSGVIYKREWGEIKKRGLILITIYIITLISLAVLLGHLTLMLVGKKIAKLISILLLGGISVVFYIIMSEPNNKELITKRTLKLEYIEEKDVLKQKEESTTALVNLIIVTSIDVAVVSFIAATLTDKFLVIIIIFSLIDLLSIRVGNLISV
ncbi:MULTISPECIES: hypothetical protein [unclassified Candidatus Frackibacter]|uniref:hypothetical protein n=1 Tax=unclassified Candidatus Frackibacter TaxID=2648818 RepID=UPI000888BBF9|nr:MULTISPECIES: hypothetical protein [unclassified Candidatus Frackibacter]SDC41055.1 hypothetical protein SAMN04515661_10965 [Candidatus Frackibacter sp. WG11]SEM59839.1 hypothetical protein SAMN04488698_10855 [Candidatus Frackibacter sp. WG12]SFL62242.1 hypothetical protein SAMN04488699_10764 [Candidatus Frackibacter sp. WG13]